MTKYHNIYAVYTKEAETADTYIERATYGRAPRVRVATSDGAEQLIILGHGALQAVGLAFRGGGAGRRPDLPHSAAIGSTASPAGGRRPGEARRRQEDKP